MITKIYSVTIIAFSKNSKEVVGSETVLISTSLTLKQIDNECRNEVIDILFEKTFLLDDHKRDIKFEEETNITITMSQSKEIFQLKSKKEDLNEVTGQDSSSG